MDKRMTTAEFKALPIHDDLDAGQFEYGKLYRRRGDVWNVYVQEGRNGYPNFGCFGVELSDNPTIMTVVDGRCHFRREFPVTSE